MRRFATVPDRIAVSRSPKRRFLPNLTSLRHGRESPYNPDHESLNSLRPVSHLQWSFGIMRQKRRRITLMGETVEDRAPEFGRLLPTIAFVWIAYVVAKLIWRLVHELLILPALEAKDWPFPYFGLWTIDFTGDWDLNHHITFRIAVLACVALIAARSKKFGHRVWVRRLSSISLRAYYVLLIAVTVSILTTAIVLRS